MRFLALGALASLAPLAGSGCAGGTGPATPAHRTGPAKIHLFFTGNVHGEIEPCG